MIVPLKVTNALNALADARQAHEDRKRKYQPDRQERFDRADAVRTARRTELLEKAQAILNWLVVFLKHREVERFWDLLGREARVPIFSAYFWDGLPIDDNGSQAFTCVTLDGHGHHFHAEEVLNGEVRRKTPRLLTPGDFFDRLHPELLLGLHAHLTGPNAWNYVLEEIEAVRKRYEPALR